MATDNLLLFPNAAPSSASGRRLIPVRLKDARELKRLNQSDLAEIVSVSRQMISYYEQGQKTPEPDTMTRIADALGQPLSYFLSEELPTFGENSIRFYRAFGAQTKKRNLMCDVYGKWLAQVAKYFDGDVNFPKVDVPDCFSPISPTGRYSAAEIEAAADACRKSWGLGLGPITNVVALLESKGITVCRVEVLEENIDAFSFWNGPRPFIFLTTDKDSGVRVRYDAAHELGHLILHRWADPADLEDKKTLKVIEAEANRFAAAFLLPSKSFANEVYTPRLDAFLDLKRRWKVAIQAMVYRCKDLGIFDEDQVTNLYKQISKRKWRTREPLDDPRIIPIEKPKYLKQALELVISRGRKQPEEIALDLGFDRRITAEICGVPKDFFDAGEIKPFTPTLKE